MIGKKAVYLHNLYEHDALGTAQPFLFFYVLRRIAATRPTGLLLEFARNFVWVSWIDDGL